MGAAGLLLSLFGGAVIALADTPAELQSQKVGGCYCHCDSGRKQSNCVKMCDTPRYAATHKWATRCVKPPMEAPTEEHDAGPRYAHPGRAERARKGSE